MTRERLKEILAAYGADPSRWPAGERAAALELLARSPELESDRADAARLDAALDAASAVGDLGLTGAALAGRITRAAANVRMFPKRRRFAGTWPGLAGLAAAAAAGLFIGWLGIGGDLLGYGAGGAAVEQADGFVPTEGELW